jgi:hypothetical protein
LLLDRPTGDPPPVGLARDALLLGDPLLDGPRTECPLSAIFRIADFL